MGRIKVKMRVNDYLAQQKTFDAVIINLRMKTKNGITINLPILPKIKDDKGNVYCHMLFQ